MNSEHRQKSGRRTSMRAALLALMAIGTLSAIDVAPAEARDYPYCIRGRDYAPLGDCRYDSYAQCEASASGLYAFCDRNYYYNGNRTQDSRRYRRSANRHYRD